MLRIASDLLAEETKMGMKDVRNRATKSAKPPAGRTKTDGFALSPQNGAAVSLNGVVGVSDLAGDGSLSVHPRVPKEGRNGPTEEG